MNREKRSGAREWTLAAIVAFAIGFYIFRHWELLSQPVAGLAEAFLR